MEINWHDLEKQSMITMIVVNLLDGCRFVIKSIKSVCVTMVFVE